MTDTAIRSDWLVWAEQLQQTRQTMAAALDHYSDLLDLGIKSGRLRTATEGIALDTALDRLTPHLADIMALFPDPADLTMAAWLKVREEWNELLDEVNHLVPDADNMGKEVADVLVSLIIWARVLGLDVARHLEQKSRVVAGRRIEQVGDTWHHVKEAHA